MAIAFAICGNNEKLSLGFKPHNFDENDLSCSHLILFILNAWVFTSTTNIRIMQRPPLQSWVKTYDDGLIKLDHTLMLKIHENIGSVLRAPAAEGSAEGASAAFRYLNIRY